MESGVLTTKSNVGVPFVLILRNGIPPPRMRLGIKAGDFGVKAVGIGSFDLNRSRFLTLLVAIGTDTNVAEQAKKQQDDRSHNQIITSCSIHCRTLYPTPIKSQGVIF